MESAFWINYSSPLGNLCIRGSDRSIHAVDFAEPTGDEERPMPVLHLCAQQLDEYFADKRRVFDLPLSPQGTAFQQRVWDELQTIAFGHTVSYLDVARKIANDKTIRAVGLANGQNKIAIIIPCHRVIGSDGSLTGYAGGLWRKQWLLEHEQRIAHGVQKLF